MKPLFNDIPDSAFWWILQSYAFAGEQPIFTLKERSITLYNYSRFAIDKN